MARRKQDWSPRGMTLARCDVTLEYDKLPSDVPEAIDLINELIQDSDPKLLIEQHDMTPAEAGREAERFRRLVEAYKNNEWSYIRIFAHTLVPSLDPGARFMERVATSGDILESNWPPKAIKTIEESELKVLQSDIEERGYNCRKFHVLRLGSFALQHPKAPKEQTWTVELRPSKRAD